MSTNSNRLHKIRMTLLMVSIPVFILEITGIILLIAQAVIWPIILYLIVAVPYGIWLTKYYTDHVDYMCPHCNKVFSPPLKENLLAPHTLTKRKLHCPDCNTTNWCTEVAKEGY